MKWKTSRVEIMGKRERLFFSLLGFDYMKQRSLSHGCGLIHILSCQVTKKMAKTMKTEEVFPVIYFLSYVCTDRQIYVHVKICEYDDLIWSKHK